MERKLTVRVDLVASGNLSSKLGEAGSVAAKLGKSSLFGDLRESRAADIAKMERQLAYSRTSGGAAQIVQQNRVASQLARQNDWLGRVAERGRLGAWADLVSERAGQVGGAAGRVAFGGAAVAGGVLASGAPAAWEQVTNSARLMVGELATGLIPQAVRLSYYLQQGAYWIRSVNQATNGWAGSLAGYAIAGGAVVWAGSRVVSLLGTGVSMAATLARWAGFGAAASAPAAGAGGALSTAGAASAGVASLAVPLMAVAGLTVPIYVLARSINALRNPNSPLTPETLAPAFNWLSQQVSGNDAPAPLQNVETSSWAALAAHWANRMAGGAGAAVQITGGTEMVQNAAGEWVPASGQGVMNMMNRNPQIFDLSQLYDRFVMAAQPNEPVALAQQQLEQLQLIQEQLQNLNNQANNQN